MVTGASSGIGLELARQLAGHDFDLIIAGEDAQLAVAVQNLHGNVTTVEDVRVDPLGCIVRIAIPGCS